MNRRNLFILLALMSFVSLKAQQFSTSMPVKINGYIIALDGAILFQPADSTISLWESLDNRSSAIWCNPFDDFYCEAIAGIGREVLQRKELSIRRFLYQKPDVETNPC